MSDLYKIVEWVKKSGDEKAVARMKVFALGDLLKEGIKLEEVTASTSCSAALVDTVRKAAETVTKQKCPF